MNAAVDRLIYYAGWSDKYQQVFSGEPRELIALQFLGAGATGVVGLLLPEDAGLLGLVSNIAPAIVGGNTCVALASATRPLTAVALQVLHASDVPGGVVNVLTGYRGGLSGQFASHMDLNAVVYCDDDEGLPKRSDRRGGQREARYLSSEYRWGTEQAQSPYLIRDTQEGSDWHPIGPSLVFAMG